MAKNRPAFRRACCCVGAKSATSIVAFPPQQRVLRHTCTCANARLWLPELSMGKGQPSVPLQPGPCVMLLAILAHPQPRTRLGSGWQRQGWFAVQVFEDKAVP